jgi:hypothetical protein
MFKTSPERLPLHTSQEQGSEICIAKGFQSFRDGETEAREGTGLA